MTIIPEFNVQNIYNNLSKISDDISSDVFVDDNNPRFNKLNLNEIAYRISCEVTNMSKMMFDGISSNASGIEKDFFKKSYIQLNNILNFIVDISFTDNRNFSIVVAKKDIWHFLSTAIFYLEG